MRERQCPALTGGSATYASAALRWTIVAAAGAVLLTPFVITPETFYPFVVGKALWSRCLIAIVVALWAWLAAIDPAYRPPRSWVLGALAAVLGTSFLAALSGVSLQRSLWSEYQRMRGVVDLAHWVAFAMVLATVFRTSDAWRKLLLCELALSSAMVCLVLARMAAIEIPFFSGLPEKDVMRPGGPFGNPNYLGHYMLLNLVLALGFLTHQAMRPTKQPEQPSTGHRKYARRLSFALPWLAVAALHAVGLSLSGSKGALAGLVAGVAYLAVVGAYCANPGWPRRAAVAALLVLAATAAGAGVSFFAPQQDVRLEIDNPLLRRTVEVNFLAPTVQTRLVGWRAGVQGFAARPLLGWGPENYPAVFGRFATGYGATARPLDSAHAKLIDVAATSGSLGLVAYLVLWGAALLVLWRAAAHDNGKARALPMFVGAALVASFVQSQTLFDTATSSLLNTLIFAFAIHMESTGQTVRCGRRVIWSILAVVVTALAATDLSAHRAVHAAADASVGLRGPHDYARGIDAFKPLANSYRLGLVENTGKLWVRMHRLDPTGAFKAFELAQAAGEEAIRVEPANWRIRNAIAKMHRAVADTNPGYEHLAQRSYEEALRLAPNRPVFPVQLAPPRTVAARLRDGGGVELRWQPSRGAGFHMLSQRDGDGPWRILSYVYDPARSSLTVPARPGPGPHRYRICACEHPDKCTKWAEWPQPIRSTEG